MQIIMLKLKSAFAFKRYLINRFLIILSIGSKVKLKLWVPKPIYLQFYPM